MKNISVHADVSMNLFSKAALVGLCISTILLVTSNSALAQVAAPLGTAQNFAVLGASTVTNTGPSVITGDLGVSPGTAVTGFPPGTIMNGVIYSADATSLQAQSDATTAYGNLAAQACTTTYGTPTDIGGLTLTPGVYCFASSAQLTGMLTLDGGGNPNAVFVFKTGSTLTTASNASVRLTNSAQECKVFWQVGSSATLGTGTTFVGAVIALASITIETDSTLAGRALALNGAVTLDSDKVSFSPCHHACYEVTSKVTHTIQVAPPVSDGNGNMIPGSVAGAALSPDETAVWVTGYNGTTRPGFVSQLNVGTYVVDSTITVGLVPSDVAFSQTLRAWVTNQYDSTLSQISVLGLKKEDTINVGTAQYPFSATFTNGYLLVTTLGNSGMVPVYKTTWPLTLQKAISVSGQSGRSITVPAKATYQANKVLVPVFIGEGIAGQGHPALSIVDSATANIVQTIALPTSGAVPEAVVVTPNGKYAYVSLFDSSGGSGGVWVVDLQSMSTKKVINTGDSANFGEAMAVDGRYLLVAGFKQNQVALIYTASNSVDNIIQGGQQPNAVVLTSGDSQAFITNQTDGTVTVMSFSPHL
jgi:hypothetical protein